jgi:hypothetical protein
MSCRFFVVIFLFSFVILPVTGQQTDTFVEEWKQYRNADDHEKNFKEISFLRALERFVKNCDALNRYAEELNDWKIEVSEDAKFSVLATVVSYELRPDKFIYCIKSNDSGTAFGFSREINRPLDKGWTLNYDLLPLSEDTLVGLKVFVQGKLWLDIPDLNTAILLESLLRSGGSESIFQLSEKIQKRLSLMMSQPELFFNDFSGFSGLSTLLLPKEGLKIVTWNIEERDGDHHFYGKIAINKGEGQINVFQLRDNFRDISQPEYASLQFPDWYGAVYYHVIPIHYKKDIYYTLLGYNGKDAFSKLRVIDVLYFNEKGYPNFGASVFNINGRLKKRLLFEYNNNAGMMLKYDEREKKIVMDHLSPMDAEYAGDRSYYVPDLTYDALEYRKGRWVLIQDIEFPN